jgi:hypothetical protein
LIEWGRAETYDWGRAMAAEAKPSKIAVKVFIIEEGFVLIWWIK